MVKKIVIGLLGMGMLFSQQSCTGSAPDKTTKSRHGKNLPILKTLPARKCGGFTVKRKPPERELPPIWKRINVVE